MYGLKRLGEWLIQRNKVTPEQLEEALLIQQQHGGRLGEILMELGYITEEDLWQTLADHYEVPYESLDLRDWDASLKQVVPEHAASKYLIFPVSSHGETVKLAMADPNNVEAIDMVQAHTSLRVVTCFAPAERILQAISKYYGIEHELIDAEFEHNEEEDDEITQVKKLVHEPPVIRLVNAILNDAIMQRASDVHFEPHEKQLEVRFRIDGVLYRVRTIPRPLQASVLSRVKLLSEMDIAERRKAQDGRFSVRINEMKVDIRASSLPTIYGERIVLRLLNRDAALLNLIDLGMPDQVRENFQSMMEQPWGMILVTGPTGSGKTTTLYAALQHLRSDRRNILTCEDPIEYALHGIGQSQVNERAGLTFAAQLRSILRQDPDVIMIGEIRDQETAEIACRAAMTGHMVVATLHTNDSVSAIPRLLDMGIPPFLLTSSLSAVIAQRLVRRLCPKCKEPQNLKAKDMPIFLSKDSQQVYTASGCVDCNHIGYRGRVGLYELFAISDPVRELMSKRADADALRLACPPGTFFPMIEDGAGKVLAGLTSPDEVLSQVSTGTYLMQEVA